MSKRIPNPKMKKNGRNLQKHSSPLLFFLLSFTLFLSFVFFNVSATIKKETRNGVAKVKPRKPMTTRNPTTHKVTYTHHPHSLSSHKCIHTNNLYTYQSTNPQITHAH
ncbi:hypothetical protein Dimus_039374 [Dionaea muscipula]